MTADEVAEAHGHHTVCEELRKHMHGDHRPLNKVCTHVDVCQHNQFGMSAKALLHNKSIARVHACRKPFMQSRAWPLLIDWGRH